MGEYHDELMGHVPWGDNRQVLVFRRMYGGKCYVRVRIFNQHRKHGVYYPGPRAFQASQECARELGLAIARAAGGRISGPPPDWWPEFQEQYEAKGKLAAPTWKRRASTSIAETPLPRPSR